MASGAQGLLPAQCLEGYFENASVCVCRLYSSGVEILLSCMLCIYSSPITCQSIHSSYLSGLSLSLEGLGHTPGLLLVLCSRNILGNTWGITCSTRDRTRVSYIEGKCLIIYSISLAPSHILLEAVPLVGFYSDEYWDSKN